MKARVAFVLGVAAVLAASSLALGTTRTFDFTTGYGTPDQPCGDTPPRNPPMFNRPGYGYQTAAYVDGTDGCGYGAFNPTNTSYNLGTDSLLTDDFYASQFNCNEIRFSWTNPADDKSWVRVPTYRAGSPAVTPTSANPTVHLGVGSSISMKIMAFGTDGNAGDEGWVSTGALEIALCIRETGKNFPLGNDGGDSGTVEFVGVDTKGVTGDENTPIGGVVIASNGSSPPGEFTTVKWTFVDRLPEGAPDGVVDGVDVSVTPYGGSETVYQKKIVSFSGDGILSASYNRGTLDGLAIRKAEADDQTKKWYVDIDDVVIDAPSVTTEPVGIQAPLSVVQTSVTVTTIDPAATAVKLYVTPAGGSRTLVATHTGPFPDGTTTFGPSDNLPPEGSDYLRLNDVYEATQVIDGGESEYSAGVTVQSAAIIIDNFDTYPTEAARTAVWSTVYSGGSGNSYNPVLDINNVFQTCPNALKLPGGIGSTGTVTRRSRSLPNGPMQGSDEIPLWFQWKVYVAGNSSAYYCAGRHYLQLNPSTAFSSSYIGMGVYSSLSFWNWSYVSNASTPTWTASTKPITFNTWHTLAVKITTSSLQYFVDGESIGTGTRGGFTGTINGIVLGGPYSGGSTSKPNCDQWIDSICASYGQTPEDANPARTDMVTLLGPLPAGATTVKVSGVNAAASAITIYDGATVIGTKTSGIVAGINEVTVSALVAGHSIQASQTVNPLGESCASAPIVVGACSPVPGVTVSGPLSAGQTTVTVTGVKTSEYPATDIKIYADGALIATGPATGATTTVTVPPLVAGKTIKATQVVNTIEGCMPAWGPIVGSGSNGSLYLTLGIKENAALNPGPQTIGADGTSGGSGWQWIGSTTRIGDAPVGKPISPSRDWQTITFDPATDPISATSLGTTGTTTGLDGTYGIIDHLGITTGGTDTGPYVLYIDNVENDGVTFGTFENPPYVAGTNTVMFRQPSYSGTTSGNIWASPNYTRIDAAYGDGSLQSNKVTFAFVDNAASRWVRLVTYNAPGGLPNPIINLTKPTTFRILLLPACKTPTIDGPIKAGDTTVSLTGCDVTADGVKVYGGADHSEVLADPTTVTGAAMSVTLKRALVKGDVVSVVQIYGGVENCYSTPATAGSGHNAGLLLSLGIRENTSLTGGIGEDGGTTGANITWIGASSKNGGAPVGKAITPSSSWQTIEFDPVNDPKLAFTGAGTLNGAFGVLEHLAVTVDPANPDTGPYVLYIDNITNGSTVFGTYENPPYAPDTASVGFRPPAYSGSTDMNVLAVPSVSVVDGYHGDASAQSVRLEWQFRDESPSRWVRVTSGVAAGNQPNPMVNLTQKITISYLLLPACSATTVSAVETTYRKYDGTYTKWGFAGETLSVKITGTNFSAGASVKLKRTGQAAISAVNVVVDSDTQITCDLNLAGAATGKWDVEVTSCGAASLAEGFEVMPACNNPPQNVVDEAGDGGDVDIIDFSAFSGCFNGPNNPWPGPPIDSNKCRCFDIARDGDVDILDFGAFSQCFNGPNQPPACR